MKQKKKLGIIIAIVAAVLVVGVMIFFALKPNGINSQEETSDEKGYHELADGENPADIDVKVMSSNDFVKPGKDTLDASKIQGYSAKVGDSDKNDDSKDTEKAEQIVLSDSNLTVESIGAYSGSFIEDGSDEATKNVTAMLITNNSDQMLQVALIDFQVNSNETASFKVTNLPAGTSTLVLESNKREFSDKDTYTYGNAATGYMDQPTLEEDKVELKTENGKITLKNKTKSLREFMFIISICRLAALILAELLTVHHLKMWAQARKQRQLRHILIRTAVRLWEYRYLIIKRDWGISS